MAALDARDTTILSGWDILSAPPANSLIPSPTFEGLMQRESPSSLIVIGRDGSMRPWLIQFWTRSRFSGVMSTTKLKYVAKKEFEAYVSSKYEWFFWGLLLGGGQKYNRERKEKKKKTYLAVRLFNPRIGFVSSSFVCPPLNPNGTFPCCF